MKTFALLLSKRRMGNLFPASMKNWNETAWETKPRFVSDLRRGEKVAYPTRQHCYWITEAEIYTEQPS